MYLSLDIFYLKIVMTILGQNKMNNLATNQADVQTYGYFPLITNSESMRWFLHYFYVSVHHYQIVPLIIHDNGLELVSFVIQIMNKLGIIKRLAVTSGNPWKLMINNPDLGVLVLEKGENLPVELQNYFLRHHKLRFKLLIPLLASPKPPDWRQDFSKTCSPPIIWPSWRCRREDWRPHISFYGAIPSCRAPLKTIHGRIHLFAGE